MKKLAFILILVSLFCVFTDLEVFAQIEKMEKIEREIEKEKALREKIEKKKEKPQVEEKKVPPVAPPIAKEKTLIKKINVVAAVLLSEKEIRDIVMPYENKELTVAEMQKAADLITDAYRKKGYITSRAYLPPQKIERGILEIRIIEGITGNIDIKGNRYFKTSLLRNKINLKKGDPFNYETLRKGMTRINEHPDREAKATLMPGKEAGATDLVLDIKENLPFHISLDYDNFGSRYIDEDRFRTTLTHNNLLGRDDVFYIQYQTAEAENYRLLGLRYLLPVNEDFKLGFFAAQYRFPYLPLASYEINPKVVDIVPARLAKAHMLMPVDRTQNILNVAMSNPLNIQAIKEVETASHCSVRTFLATSSDVKMAIDRHYNGME